MVFASGSSWRFCLFSAKTRQYLPSARRYQATAPSVNVPEKWRIGAALVSVGAPGKSFDEAVDESVRIKQPVFTT
jgi:hypothetical protein